MNERSQFYRHALDSLREAFGASTGDSNGINSSVVSSDELREVLEKGESMLSQGDYEDALRVVFEACFALRSSQELAMNKVHLPSLDQLIARIGLSLTSDLDCQSQAPAEKQDLDIIVATEIYATGGHTRVIEDIVKYGEGRFLLVLTDLFGHYSSGRLNLVGCNVLCESASAVLLPNIGLAGKVRDLHRLLRDLAPRNVWLLAHHEDVVAYSACNSNLKSRAIYVHHCDANPTLGATIKSYDHVDILAPAFEMCRDSNLIAPKFLPLFASPPSHTNSLKSYIQTSTATSGRSNKFRFDGELAYPEIVARVIEATQKPHLHIGYLEPTHIECIETALNERGIEPSLFKYLGTVQSVSQALVDHQVDVYITSAPEGGGKALIEALSAKIALLVYVNERNNRLVDRYHKDTLPSVFKTWSNIDQLCTGLKNLDVSLQAAQCLKFYEANHSLDAFTVGLRHLQSHASS